MGSEPAAHFCAECRDVGAEIKIGKACPSVEKAGGEPLTGCTRTPEPREITKNASKMSRRFVFFGKADGTERVVNLEVKLA